MKSHYYQLIFVLLCTLLLEASWPFLRSDLVAAQVIEPDSLYEVPVPQDAPAAVREGIEESNRALREDPPEILPETKKPGRSPLVIFGILMGLGLIGGVGYLVFKQKLILSPAKPATTGGKGTLATDQTRRADLKRLQAMIEAFYKMQKRYPTENEFMDLRQGMENPPQDPQDEQPVPGREDAFYGYHYTRTRPETQEDDAHYYALWSYLADGEELRLTSADKQKKEMALPLPATPPAAQAVSMPAYYPVAASPHSEALSSSSQWVIFLAAFLMLVVTLINLVLIVVNLLLVNQLGNIRVDILRAQTRIEQDLSP